MSNHICTNSLIVYKYNKYAQINGSLLYAFDYLLAAMDKIFKDNNVTNINNILVKDLPTLCIIGLPSSIKLNYLDNLNKLIAGKYPHLNNKRKVNKALDYELDHLLLKDSIGYNNTVKIKEDFNKQVKVVRGAIQRIKFPTDIEFRKIIANDNNRIVFTSTNSILNYLDCFSYLNNTKVKLIQNRNIQRSKDLKKKLINIKNLEYLYELPQQKPIKLDEENGREYAPKICFDYYINKKILDLFPQSFDIIVNHSQMAYQDQNVKPQFFCQMKDHFFLNTGRIRYVRNLTRWEENVRIIPEAKFYGIKIIIKEENEQLRFDEKSSDLLIPEDRIDSSVTRMNNKWEDYKILPDDYLIKFILREDENG